jgi:tetratricopeptide (TPR) repeat protein
MRRSAIVAVFGLLMTASAARADEFQDFQQARDAYRNQDYAVAAKRFEALVGDEPPRMQNKPLRLESRKYLGASYLFLKRKKEAVEQFNRLLTEDPDYQLDPLAFPAQVVETFGAVKKDVLERLKTEATAKEQSTLKVKEKEILERMERGNRLQALIDLAEEERVEEHNSRWIAMLPFGVGQFNNGHESLGTALAIVEGILAAVSIVSFIIYQTIDIPVSTVGEPESDARQDAIVAEEAWYITNLSSTLMFAAVATAGVIDAQVRFRPVVSRVRHRPLPQELRDDLQLQASFRPTGFRIRF